MILQHFFNYPIMLVYSLVERTTSENFILFLGVGVVIMLLCWFFGRLIGR